LPQVGLHHEAVAWIGVDHVGMRFVMTAERKTARGRVGRNRKADGARVLMDVGGRAQRPSGPNWQHGNRAAGVISDKNIVAGRIDTEVRRACSLRTHNI
jgi:hypothetical protein